jgi:hypothetical protein
MKSGGSPLFNRPQPRKGRIYSGWRITHGISNSTPFGVGILDGLLFSPHWHAGLMTLILSRDGKRIFELSLARKKIRPLYGKGNTTCLSNVSFPRTFVNAYLILISLGGKQEIHAMTPSHGMNFKIY